MSLVSAIAGIEWLEIIKALAPVVTAVIAFSALRNWQKQDKAKREAEFLDLLIEATHTYISEMPKPIFLVEMIKIGMASHISDWESDEEKNKQVKGAIKYINKYGNDDAKRLLKILEEIQSSKNKLCSLIAKGQIFNFDNYQKCQNAVDVITKYFEQIEGFTTIIGSNTLNWENPEIEKCLIGAMAIDPEEIRASIRSKNIDIIEFSRDNYMKIYN